MEGKKCVMKRDRMPCPMLQRRTRAMLLVSLCLVASSSLVPEHDAQAEDLPPPRLHLYLDEVDVRDGDASHPFVVPAHAAVHLEYEMLSFDPASCGELALLVLVDGGFHYKMQPVQSAGEVVFPDAFGAGSHTLSVSILEAASGTALWSAAMLVCLRIHNPLLLPHTPHARLYRSSGSLDAHHAQRPSFLRGSPLPCRQRGRGGDAHALDPALDRAPR